MILHLDNYRFPIYITETEWDDYIDICIGNLSCKPKPCIHITVEKNHPEAGINAIQFYESCSISTRSFKRGSGAMVLFVKTALKWLFQAYPYLHVIHLQDDSYYEDTTSKTITMLPEKMVLTEGKTWYEKHFNALPSKKTQMVLELYKYIHRQHSKELKRLPESAWYETTLANTLKPYSCLEYKKLSGAEWSIPRNIIEDYECPAFHLSEGGSLQSQSTLRRRIPRPF